MFSHCFHCSEVDGALGGVTQLTCEFDVGTMFLSGGGQRLGVVLWIVGRPE